MTRKRVVLVMSYGVLQVAGFLAIGPLSIAVHDLWAQVFALIR